MVRSTRRRNASCLVVALVVPAVALVSAPPLAAETSVSVQRVSFPVHLDPRNTHDVVWGKLYRPAGSPGCASSVLLLLHDLSYASHQWDFPLQPERYSMARALASAGFPALAIDLPGQGSSGHSNGYRFTIPLYADITDQIIRQLREGTYRSHSREAIPFARVGLVGAGIGTETAELAVARYGGADALVATAYTHFLSPEFLQDYLVWDVPQTTGDDYTTFGAIPERRVKYLYNIEAADREVVKKDAAIRTETPSGVTLSMLTQPSSGAMGSIGIPVLLLLAERDYMFPVAHARDELDLFVGAADRPLAIVPAAGHSLLLHRNAPAAHRLVVDWLRGRPTAVPSC